MPIKKSSLSVKLIRYSCKYVGYSFSYIIKRIIHGVDDNSRVIYIGGPSASGKSTVAEKLALELNYRMVRLDTYYNDVSVIFKEDTARAIMWTIAPEILRYQLRKDDNCILEGAWVNPAAAKKND